MDQKDRDRLEDALDCAASYKAEAEALRSALKELVQAGGTAWHFRGADTNAILFFANALTSARATLARAGDA